MKFIITLFCSLFLLGYGQQTIALTSNKTVSTEARKYGPKINPHPKYFMTIYGKTNFKYPAIKLVVYYQTENPDCYEITNKVEGVSAARSKTIYYPIKNYQGIYIIKIPIDKFLPGQCKWKIQSITYTTHLNHNNFANGALIYFEKKSEISAYEYSKQHFVINCSSKQLYQRCSADGFHTLYSIDRSHDWKLNLDIFSEENHA